MQKVDTTWNGVSDPAVRAALTSIAEKLEIVLNWDTDGSVEIEQNRYSSRAWVPGPFDFRAFILNGTQPYSWVMAEPDQNGVCHAKSIEEATIFGNIAGYQVATVVATMYLALSVVLTLDASYPAITLVTQVGVYGINPTGYNVGLVTPTAIGTDGLGRTTVTVPVPSFPGSWVAGGAVIFADASQVAYNQGWEANGNTQVVPGTLVWMRPKYKRPDNQAQDYDFFLPASSARLLIRQEESAETVIEEVVVSRPFILQQTLVLVRQLLDETIIDESEEPRPYLPCCTRVGKTSTSISAISGTTPGSGTVEVWALDPAGSGAVIDQGYSVTAYNLSTTAISSGVWVELVSDTNGQYYVLNANC